MPHFTFTAAELTAEHKRSPVRDVVLQVEPQEGDVPQVTGELAMDLVNMENKLRLGQVVELKLTAPDGRFTRVAVLLIELKGIDAPAPKQRTYRWAFLVPVRPGHDPQGIFRRADEPAPEQPWHQQPFAPWDTSPRPATLGDDPQAQEISLADLLTHLGSSTSEASLKFTSEGGIVEGRSP